MRGKDEHKQLSNVRHTLIVYCITHLRNVVALVILIDGKTDRMAVPQVPGFLPSLIRRYTYLYKYCGQYYCTNK